ncbi:MAG: protein MpaA [Chitinophagales bacterium]|jgi:protein MpaA
MLILTRSQPAPHSIIRIVRLVFLLLILATLSTCNGIWKNDINTAKPAIENQQNSDNTENEDLAKRLLEDGFYQQQTSETDISGIRLGDRDSDSTAELTAELAGAEKNGEPEQPSNNLNKVSRDSKSLIEDLGFSAAEQNQKTETLETEYFCLDRQYAEPNSERIKDACRQISKRLASVKYSACEAAQLELSGCSSTNGFPILMREFAPFKERKPQGRILIVGGTHGDELTSVSVTMRWIEKLNQYHSGLFHWHLAPMMNPDGVLKSGATRTNANGVDLNRNMPSDDWERNALKYWDQKGGKDPRKYPGATASSEPETQWLIDEINSFKPDAIISVHAPYGVVDFDSLLLNTAPKSLGKLRLNLLGTYPGSLGNYAGINLNIPVITLELPHSWVMLSEAESTQIWEDIVSWLKKNVNADNVYQ